MISTTQLLLIMPDAGNDRVAVFVDPLNNAMYEFQINTAHRRSCFLAQIAHETESLHYMRELADGSHYEGRADLGNTQPGDGPLFRGRGLLMATGRGMYAKLTAALQTPFTTQPHLLEQPVAACRSGAWIWTVEKKLNQFADKDQFGAISWRINGGFNGLDSRIGFWLRARKAEGL